MINNKNDLEKVKNKFIKNEQKNIQIKIAMSVCAKSSGAEKFLIISQIK